MYIKNDVMLQLGEYQFAVPVSAYQSIECSSSWRWESQQLIGTKPNVQYTGEDDETISLSGVSYTTLAGNANLPDTIREMARQKKPYLLVSGDGKVHGEWAITGFKEGATAFFQNGRPRKIDFSIELKFIRK